MPDSGADHLGRGGRLRFVPVLPPQLEEAAESVLAVARDHVDVEVGTDWLTMLLAATNAPIACILDDVTKLVYTAIASLDGYIEDEEGNFGWAAPDEEVHAFVNDLERPVGTHLYGRRLYETMAVWETDPALAAHSAVTRDFAQIWQAADKVVYSRTLEAPATGRTRIERDFDPAAVRELKRAAERDLTVGGPELAAEAFKAELVDECNLFLAPVAVGSGKPALPRDFRVGLELLDERRFEGGMVHLHYRVAS